MSRDTVQDGIKIRAVGENANILFFVGKKYEGKTYLAKHLLKKVKQYLMWDENREHDDMGTVATKLQDVILLWNMKKRKVVYQPPTEKKTQQGFNEFCLVALMLSNAVIYCEEVRLYAQPNKIPINFARLMDGGRFRGLGIWCTSRRMLRLAVEIPYNADHVFAFKQKRQKDLEALKDYIDEDMVDQIPNLPKYHFVHYVDETGTAYIHKPI